MNRSIYRWVTVRGIIVSCGMTGRAMARPPTEIKSKLFVTKSDAKKPH